ncbi:MAG: MarR family transcriptional regulator [Ruminococcaceae bacterium]|nr:MarR family transcriptional regulator [Oscillospiraceae bacterium]
MATIMRKMNAISRCEAIYRTREFGEDMHGIYHSYVFAICINPGMSQEKIARHMCLNKSSVTRHLEWLEKNGYVERQTGSEDRRELLVYPTEKMLGIFPEIKRITFEWNRLVAEGISEEELGIFHRILDKMLERSAEIIYSGEQAK